MEFLQNCWEYIVAHKDYLVTFLTSAQFAAIVTLFVNIIRQGKDIKSSNTISNTLNNSITANNKMSEAVTDIDTTAKEIVDMTNKNKEETDAKLKSLADNVESLTNKLNSVLEVQTVVYSTIRDEEMRTTVNNILNNARYADGNVKEELEKRMEQLENDIKAKMEDVNNAVKNSIDNVKSTVAVNPERSNVRRY